ncbi:MAG: hypothetical protein AAF414_05145 [Pseudomonadota bacterium]
MTRRASQVSAWLFIVFLTLAVSSVALAQPMIPRGSPSPEYSGFLDHLPAPISAVVREINTLQVDLSRRLNTELAELRGGSGAFLWLCAIGFVYGALHAAGPGHGKAVVASFLLARRLSIRKAIGASFLMAMAQGVTAVVLVGVLAVLLDLTGPALTGRADWLELGSYALIVLLGAAMLVNSLRGRHVCGHSHGAHDHPSQQEHSARGLLPLGAAVALRPCTGALLILLFTLANGLFLAGIAAVAAMAVGVGLTVALIALATIGVRHMSLVAARGHDGAFVFAQRGFAIFGSAAVLAFGVLFLLAALSRLT